MRFRFTTALALTFLLNCALFGSFNAQSGGHTLYGDIRVDESKVTGLKPISFDIILYNEGRVLISRQTVSTAGRYRFNNLTSGFYDVAVEVESQEIARVRIDLSSPYLSELRKDLFFEWSGTGANLSPKPALFSTADNYQRSSANAKLLEKANEALDRKRYNTALQLTLKIIAADPKDFQALTVLGNVYLIQKNYAEAENAYLRAIDLHPQYFPALLNLGRTVFSEQKYDVAIEVLKRAVKVRPDSADANYFLGESYLQTKKGSLAVGYLNEALRLNPTGLAAVHLRLASLYIAAGAKDKAASEYEAFLKKQPNYKGRKKLEQFIAENKKH